MCYDVTTSGQAAGFSNEDYLAAGAQIVTKQQAWGCDVVTKIKPPSEKEVDMMKQGALYMGFVYPSQNPELVRYSEL